MTVLNGDWISRHLTGERGEKARLARAMRITPAKLSHILKGKRDVQPEEVLPLLSFFKETIGEAERSPLVDVIRDQLPYLDKSAQAAVAALAKALARDKPVEPELPQE